MSETNSQLQEPLDVPVVVIIFRRPYETQRVFDSIAKAKPKRVYIVSDGPRSGNSNERLLVEQSREVFSRIDWNCEVREIFSESNLGLRSRILTGLDQVFSEVDRAIILEDDCPPDNSFLWFSRELLSRYETSNQVGLIAGTNLSGSTSSEFSYYFARSVSIWGWATWRRTWEGFRGSNFLNPTPEEVRDALGKIEHKGTRRQLSRLASQIENLDSWAVPFSLYFHSRRMLSVVPSINLIENIGFGPESTHTRFESWAHEVQSSSICWPLRHPERVDADFSAMKRESWAIFFRWWLFPLAHPVRAASRVYRFVGQSRYSFNSRRR